MRIPNRKSPVRTFSVGSALLLAVVLTSMLAIVGVLFVMASRVDKMATSAISESKELNFALETVIAKMSQELVLDVPGVADQEYYDYPDVNNIWLAALEPYESGGNYYWRQISDLTGSLIGQSRDIQALVVREYDVITDSNSPAANADADGDGVGDSKWIKLDEITSGKGKPIYAAIRIIDNGAMLNVNTAYKFDPDDPNATLFDVGGSSQMQINLVGLAQRGANGTLDQAARRLQTWRSGTEPTDLSLYEQNVVWSYGSPDGAYTPFDIGDELKLRNRYILNYNLMTSRIEELWSNAYDGGPQTPIPTTAYPLSRWSNCAMLSSVEPNDYDYRHISTTYNMDRIIKPDGAKMVNVNMADEYSLYDAIRTGLLDAEPNSIGADELAAQLAVNMVDYRDYDTDITVLPIGPTTYYGSEAQPFISEIAFRISATGADVSTNNYFAIELYNPFDADIPLSNFRLELRRQSGAVAETINLAGSAIAANARFIITNGSAASTEFTVGTVTDRVEDASLILAEYSPLDTDPPTYQLRERYDVYLLRTTSTRDLYLDKQETEEAWFDWDTIKDTAQFYCRPDIDWNVVYQNLVSTANTLGSANGVSGGRRNYNLASSVGSFVSVGDIARVLTVSPSTDPNDMIGVRLAAEPGEELVRLDLQNPLFADIFQYLTIIDPASYGQPTYETRIKGRININSAPWFVTAQLPWMMPSIAQAVVAYRDTMAGGFESIAELMHVGHMGYYAYDPPYASADLDTLPDLTPSDGAISDFEERDVIFSRISNLVTVRSDVFTVYILVRIDLDGPQRKVIAILDRSQVTSVADKVKIVAFHPVPDPR